MKNIIRLVLLTVSIFSASYAMSSSEVSCYPRVVVTTNIIQRVFFVKYKDEFGTAFTVDVDNRQYLITAKHVLENISEEDRISIFYKNKWHTVDVRSLTCGDDNTDILVLAAPIILSPPLDVSLSSDGLILAQDMYFLGFPYGMTTGGEEINRDFPVPFVKKAILSAIKKDGLNTILYLDGYNNPGFSGGPIVYHNYVTGKLNVAGVISGYRNEKSKISYKGNDTELVAFGNSGIIIGYSILPAINAIKNHAIGPIIK